MTHQVWYHGTRPEHVPEIRDRGLQTPPGVMHPAKWFQLTDSREQAERYAQPGGTVLEYHIPHELTNHRMNSDALLWPKHPHDSYDVSAHAVAPRRPIGSEYIADEHPVPEHHGSRLGFKQAARPQLDFDHEEVENGGSTWPATHTIKGIHPESGEQVGFLKYRTPRRAKDKIKIDRLEVHPEHQGNGFGSQMMDHLQERHPKTPIDHGDRTDDGQAWWASYTRGKSVQRGRTMASARFRCPCGIPVEYDVQDGWQHADGSIGHDGEFYPYSVSDLMEEHGGHTAGKGKPRRDAPDVARRADQAAEGSPGRMAPDSGRGDNGGGTSAPLRALVEHPKVARDLSKLPKNVQAAYHERVDGLRRGEPHPSTHALTGPLKGWQGTSLNFLNRVVHRYDGDELHVLSAGNHDEAYEQGARRASRYTAPYERLFGPTFGLDTRLWDEDGNLRDSVRMDVISRFNDFCHEHGYEGWHRWAKIVFFGSEASEWTSKALVGNGDFDLSIGIHYPALRATVPGFEGMSDEIIAAGLTQEMHERINDPQHRFPGVPGVFDMTWYANLQGWDIARIRPYAAYDVAADEWIVRPPHLPEWSMQDFPEGKGLADEVHGIVLMAEGILKMPEPYRTQNGAALWEFVHSNRADAFGESGEGWWDARNVVEKALDQKGLMQKLWECHDRAQRVPESLASPRDWSNTPAAR